MIVYKIQNNTTSNFYIKELNARIEPSSFIEIRNEYDWEQITNAQSIKDGINSSSIILFIDEVVQSTSDAIAYLTSPPSTLGEVNTASNVGTGAGVFKQKTGVDLEIRSISSSDFDVTEGADEIEIQADPALISNQSTVTAAAGMNALVEDSGNLRKVDVNDFLGGGGGGHEPYVGNTLITTLDLSGQSSVNNVNVNSYNGFAVGVPFMMQEDVDLNAFIVVQNNATSVGLTAKFGIFKYTGNSGAFTTPYVFTKEYQHPTDINAGITGSQSFTLTTPYTFTAGDVYMCIIVHDTPTLAAGSADKPAYTGRRTLGQSNIIGINPANLSQYGRVLQTNSNATISGGNIASTINFDVIGQGNFAATPLIYLDIENA